MPVMIDTVSRVPWLRGEAMRRTAAAAPALNMVLWRLVALATSAIDTRLVRLCGELLSRWRVQLCGELLSCWRLVVLPPAGSGVILDWLCMMRIYYSPAGPRIGSGDAGIVTLATLIFTVALLCKVSNEMISKSLLGS